MASKLIAFYLPQYHPIPENDQWWEKGFTEWTNVTRAKPLFINHNQPRIPADLGFYDLRVPEVRQQQADMAREYGITGFCYYHYWFGNGKQLLERPFNEVLASGSPDFPFMLCWANQTWKGVWFGASKGKTLIEQLYPGKQDYIAHFNYLRKAFEDHRYIRIDGKPVFNIYMPMDVPDLAQMVDTFRECAHKAGLGGLYMLASNTPRHWIPEKNGFDGVISNNFHRARHDASRIVNDRKSIFGKVESKIRKAVGAQNMEKRFKPYKLTYKKLTDFITNWPEVDFDYFPQVVPDWDNSARAGNKSYILTGSTPELWGEQLKIAKEYLSKRPPVKQILFIKSWNEWAEGNYLEPDLKWGYSYLKVLRSVFKD